MLDSIWNVDTYILKILKFGDHDKKFLWSNLVGCRVISMLEREEHNKKGAYINHEDSSAKWTFHYIILI